MDPPPPARVTAVAVQDDVLLLGGADGRFWRYGPGAVGFAGVELRRDNARILKAFDVSRLVPRERSQIDSAGGDPVAPTTPDTTPVRVECEGSHCVFHVGNSSIELTASAQPGQIRVWDGMFSETLGGDAATELLCVHEMLVVDPALCSEWARVPRLFAQAWTRAEARRGLLAPL